MHFHGSVTVYLPQNLKEGRSPCEGDPIGFVLAVGVNCNSFAEAAEKIYWAAIEKCEGNPSQYSVQSMEITKIEKEDWDPAVRRRIKSIDSPGVYYTSGLAFFCEDD